MGTLITFILLLAGAYYLTGTKSGRELLIKIRDFFLPKDFTSTIDAFTRMQLKAMAERPTIRRLLFYRSYVEEENSDIGLFKMHDGRLGIAFKIEPPVYLTDHTEKVIINILSSTLKDDTVVHITSLAGQDITDILEEYRKVHKADRIKVKHPQEVKEMIKSKIDSFYEWRDVSIMGEQADLRVRNFTHMVSILFPLDLDKEIILKQCNEAYGLLRDNFNGVVADDKDMIAYVAEVLNPSRQHYPRDDDPITTINKRMAKGASVEALNEDKDGTLKLANNWYARVLTTNKFPKSVDSFSYRAVFFEPYGGEAQIKLPCPFHLSLTVRFSNVEEQRKKVKAKSKWNIGQLGAVSHNMKKKNPELKKKLQEAEEIIHYIDELGEFVLDSAWQLVVYDKDLNKLDQYCSLIKSSFDTYPGRWDVREERFPNIAYYIMLMGLPLNYSEALHSILDKFDKNFKANNAQIAPLITGYKGLGFDKFSHLYMDRTGQLVPINFFASKENYNIVVVGPMGTGKSFFTNNFLAQGLASNWDIFMTDFGRSYLKITEKYGGNFMEFTKESNMCFNFFTYIQTTVKVIDGVEVTVIDDEETSAIIPVVGLMMGVNLKDIYTSKDSSSSEKLELTVMSTFILRACNDAFMKHGHSAGMREVVEALEEMRREYLEQYEQQISKESELLSQMIISLYNYGNPNGQFYSYFNGPNNIDINNSLNILELDDIKSSPMMPVVTMAYLQRVAQEVYIKHKEDPSKARIVGSDECKALIANEVFAVFFDDFGRRIRKYRGIPILITQAIEDYYASEGGKVYFQLASFKILLKQKEESVNIAVKNNWLSLNKHEEKLVKSPELKTPYYNEFTFIYLNQINILLLKVNADEYWSYTMSPKDQGEISYIEKKYNVSKSEAGWIMARITEGMSEDDAIIKLESKKQSDEHTNWEEVFKYAIDENKIFVEPQISKDHDNLTTERLLIALEDYDGKKHILSSANAALAIAKKMDFLNDIFKRFLKKAIEHIKNSDSDKFVISFNESLLTSKDMMSYIIEKDKELDYLGGNMMYEIDIYQKRLLSDLLHVVEFSESIRKSGGKIALSGMTIDGINLNAIVSIEPSVLFLNNFNAEGREMENKHKIVDFLNKQNIEVVWIGDVI